MNAADYNEILSSKGKDAAEKAAHAYIKGLGLPTPLERGKAWDELRAGIKTLSKKSSQPKKTTASIKAICDGILACWSVELTAKEKSFVGDMKAKRKLTEKQASWLKSIASKCNVKIDLEIATKESKTTSMDMTKEERWEYEIDMYGYSNIQC